MDHEEAFVNYVKKNYFYADLFAPWNAFWCQKSTHCATQGIESFFSSLKGFLKKEGAQDLGTLLYLIMLFTFHITLDFR